MANLPMPGREERPPEAPPPACSLVILAMMAVLAVVAGVAALIAAVFPALAA